VKTTLFSQQINLSNTPLDSLHLVEYFRSVVDALLTLDSLNSSNLFILADFNLSEFVNIKQSVQPSAKMIAMSQLIQFFNLKQFNNIPNVNGKCLDLVLSNVRDSDVVVTASNDSLVDEDHYHPSLCVSIALNSPLSRFLKRAADITSYNFRKANFPDLYHAMIDADWSSIESSSDDVNTASDSFYNILYKILNDHVPKYKNKKHKYPVWFTPQIIKNVQIKNKLRRRYMKFKNPEDLVSFRELRGSIKSDISLAYKEFVASSERNINENPKKFWQYLRQKRRGTGLPSCMSIGKSTISGPVNIVDALAKFFQSIYSDRAAVYTKFDSVSNHNNISLCSVSADEVFQSIKRIKSNYVQGPDGIPAFFCQRLC
jgi:hypothetical protein